MDRDDSYQHVFNRHYKSEYEFHNQPGLIPYFVREVGPDDDGHPTNLLLLNSELSDRLGDGTSAFVDPDEGWGRLILNGNIVLDNLGSRMEDGNEIRISMADFEYVSELGRGEQGRIFVARHRPSDTLMAIKEIQLEMNQKQMKNILVELEVLSKNISPFIINFYGSFYTKSNVYFCMEVMDFGSLDDLILLLRERPQPYPSFPDSFLAALIYSVSSGLHFLHKKLSIMHRDVKPTNLLMNKRGDIKLCDFGVSGYLVKSAAKTYVGSMTYMAPERVRANHESLDYTTQADVWSLGATLYELLLGDPLYAVSGFDSAFAHLMAISVEPSPTIPTTACSPEMASLIQSFLSKNPDDRPTFGDLLQHPLMAPFTDNLPAMQVAVTDFLRAELPALFTP